VPQVASLWNTMLKMRKLADCCQDLAAYVAIGTSSAHITPPLICSSVAVTAKLSPQQSRASMSMLRFLTAVEYYNNMM
jgi:hypothetical protein